MRRGQYPHLAPPSDTITIGPPSARSSSPTRFHGQHQRSRRRQPAEGGREVALLSRWLATEVTWNDSVRQRFEERYISPMEPAAEAAINGMRKLAEVLEKVRRDCSDRSEMP